MPMPTPPEGSTQQPPTLSLITSLMNSTPTSHSDRALIALQRATDSNNNNNNNNNTDDKPITSPGATGWKPGVFPARRRSSWDMQERRHEEQMATVKETKTGPGFSEREGRAGVYC